MAMLEELKKKDPKVRYAYEYQDDDGREGMEKLNGQAPSAQ